MEGLGVAAGAELVEGSAAVGFDNVLADYRKADFSGLGSRVDD
jgi:hypothetical protein